MRRKLNEAELLRRPRLPGRCIPGLFFARRVVGACYQTSNLLTSALLKCHCLECHAALLLIPSPIDLDFAVNLIASKERRLMPYITPIRDPYQVARF